MLLLLLLPTSQSIVVIHFDSLLRLFSRVRTCTVRQVNSNSVQQEPKRKEEKTLTREEENEVCLSLIFLLLLKNLCKHTASSIRLFSLALSTVNGRIGGGRTTTTERKRQAMHPMDDRALTFSFPVNHRLRNEGGEGKVSTMASTDRLIGMVG